jgi:uncharacterized protein
MSEGQPPTMNYQTPGLSGYQGPPPDKEAKTMGMLCHLLGLAGYIIPFGNVIGPLVIWLIKKDTMPFVNDQGKEAINFQITVLIAAIICIPLVLVVIGILLLPLIAIANIIFIIIGTIKANEGVAYRYPFAIRLIK